MIGVLGLKHWPFVLIMGPSTLANCLLVLGENEVMWRMLI